MVESLIVLNHLIPFTALLFITDLTLYVYAFSGAFIVYRFLSNYIDVYPGIEKRIIHTLRDAFAQLFIVFLILYGTKFEDNYIVFITLFAISFYITQIKPDNPIIAFIVKYFPFDAPIVLWSIFQISTGNYLAASVFVAYAGWIYWYAKKEEGNQAALLSAYAIWNAGLVCTFLSSFYVIP